MHRASKRGRTLRPPRRRGGIGSVLLIVLLLFVVTGAYVAVRTYYRLREPLSDIFATPVPVTGTPEPTPDPLTEPLNILLLGIDRRDGEKSTRNDVNVVIHIDPDRRFASMLSIPRDTRVQVPDHGSFKINATYSLGESYQANAGGGPVLAKRTVEAFLGLKIHYYAEVDFQGFERIVDLLGGVTVDVPFPLVDNEYPTEDYRYTRIYIPAGLQRIDGRTALRYARSRHADSDIGRNLRQQQVLIALRDRILRADLVKQLVSGSEQTDKLLEQFGDTVRTDIPMDTLWALYRLANRIDASNIETFALDWRCLSEDPASTDLLPSMSCLYEIVEEMQLDPVTRKLREEAALLLVLNGTDIAFLAGNTVEYLRGQGFRVLRADDAEPGVYTHTLLLDSGDHPLTCKRLVELLGVNPDYVQVGVQASVDADVVIILGEDYVLPQE